MPTNPVPRCARVRRALVSRLSTHLTGGPAMLRVSHCLLAFGLATFAAAGSLGRAQGPAKGEDGFTPLFNGKDLTGWTYKPTPKESLEGKTETADGRISVEN